MGLQRVSKVLIDHILVSFYLLGLLFLEDNELSHLVGKMAVW